MLFQSSWRTSSQKPHLSFKLSATTPLLSTCITYCASKLWQSSIKTSFSPTTAEPMTSYVYKIHINTGHTVNCFAKGFTINWHQLKTNDFAKDIWLAINSTIDVWEKILKANKIWEKNFHNTANYNTLQLHGRLTTLYPRHTNGNLVQSSTEYGSWAMHQVYNNIKTGAHQNCENNYYFSNIISIISVNYY